MITIITPTYNEEENIVDLYYAIKKEFKNLKYDYEHLVIDNSSSDKTVDLLRPLAKKDKKLKIIINARNFGHTKSPYYALTQTDSDAVILIAADFQDPPALITKFIRSWERGFKVALAVKESSQENFIMFNIRKFFYSLISKISDIELIKNATGAGIYDRDVINVLKTLQEPNPYFRGLLCEIGYPIDKITFKQPKRNKGITKNNFYTLYDLALLGITNHSKVPIRVMSIVGFTLSILSIFVAIIFLILKVLFWDAFDLGTAPIIIGIFFFGAIQTFCLGLIGEYIGSIHTNVRNFPLVVEKERINF